MPWFDAARFSGDAWFIHGKFSRTAGFIRAKFSGDTWFEGAQFSDIARFTGAQFTAASWLGPVVCMKGVDLSGALFEVPVTLRSATAPQDLCQSRQMAASRRRGLGHLRCRCQQQRSPAT